jgi:hypothetical protein
MVAPEDSPMMTAFIVVLMEETAAQFPREIVSRSHARELLGRSV